MGYILRLPSITAPTDTEKIEQIRRYLYSTIKEINWALNTLDSATPGTVEANEVSAGSTFSMIKPMIIKSGDIINAYYDVMKPRFDDIYVSKEHYGKLEAWIKIDDLSNPKTFEIGRMVGNEFVSLMKFTEDGDVILKKPYTGTQKYLNVTGNITEYSKTCQDGMTPIYVNSEVTGIPEGYGDCVGTIHKSSEKTLIMITNFTTGNTATNVFTGGEWSGWKYTNPQ